ncbi:MAG TPA: flotillin family protein [Acidimicrobiales bacterium]|nr:flotillin family protein [Acidimicrobiales bacterium]
MFGYRIPAPDEAMIISGSKSTGDGGTPFRIVTGHGRFVLPVRSKVSFLSLSMQEAEVQEPCVTKQGITLMVKAVIAFKVGDDAASIANAARRFLADEDQMPRLTGRIFAGHLRSIVGSMTVEELIRERQKLAEEVLDASKTEMAKLGLVVDSLQIESIDDQGSGYINALSQPHVAAVNQNAQIAQAQAQQAAAEAQQVSQRNQADFARQTAIAQAAYKAEVDQAQARSAQAGPLAAAQAQQEVLAEQAKVAERNAELRRQQLVAEVAAPAEAEAERIRTIARANADATFAAAEAAAANGRVALDQQLIAMLPQLTDNLAAGLANANVTILDGATGYNNLVAELGAQAAAILGAIRAASSSAGAGPPAPVGPGASSAGMSTGANGAGAGPGLDRPSPSATP